MDEKTKNRIGGLAKTVYAVGTPIVFSLAKGKSSIIKEPLPIYIVCGLICIDSLGNLITGKGDSTIYKIISAPSKIINHFNERRNIRYLL